MFMCVYQFFHENKCLNNLKKNLESEFGTVVQQFFKAYYNNGTIIDIWRLFDILKRKIY